MANPDDDITVEVGVAVDKKDIAEAKAAMKALTEALDRQFELDKKRFAHEKKLLDLQKDSIKTTDKNTSSLKKKTDQLRKVDDHLKKFQRSLSRISSPMKAFGGFVKQYLVGSLQALQKLLMPTMIGIAALGAGFLAAKVAVVGADLALRAYNVTLKALPAAAAVGLGAVAALTAAVAEIQTAANLPFYRQAGGQTQQGLANLYNSLLGDPQTALLGAQSITQTTNALMQAKVPLQQINQTVRGLGGLGFYAGGGDAAAGLQNIVGAITEISKDKNARMSAQELERLAASFGPMSDKIKEVGKEYVGKDFQEFVAFLSSSPAELGEFANGLDAANGTLIGMAKSLKNTAQAELKPFGDTIVSLTKGPLAEFKETLVVFINGVMPSVVGFFSQMLPSVFNSLSSGLDRLGGFMRETLPTMVEGFKEGVGTVRNFFQGTGRVLREFYPYLQRVSEGFDILFDTILGPVLGGITRMFGGALMELTSFFERNEEAMTNIGSTIAGLFSMDSWLMNTIKSAFQAVGTLIETLGPQILKMVDYLEAPFYLFDIINNNKDSLEELGQGLEYFVEKAFGPFFDFVVRIIEFVVQSGPDIADIFRTAANLLDPMIDLANTLLDVLESLGGIKTLFAFIIGAKVLGGLASLALAMGRVASNMAEMRHGQMLGGMSNRQIAGRAGLGAASMVGTAAGVGLLTAGMANDNVGMATAGGFLAGASPALALAMVPGGMPFAIGAGLIMGGVGAYSAYRASDRAREQNARARGEAAAATIGAGAIQFTSGYDAFRFGKRQLISQPRLDLLGASVDYFSESIFGMEDFNSRLAAERIFGAERAGSREARGAADALRGLGLTVLEGGAITGFEDVNMTEVNALLDAFFMELSAGTLELADASSTTQKNLDFLTENFGYTERAAYALAEAVGLDLSEEISDLALGILNLNDVMGQAESRAAIFSNAFEEHVYAPLREMEYRAEVAGLGTILSEGFADQTFSTDFTPEQFVISTLDPIAQEINRKLMAGLITPDEAIRQLEAEIDKVEAAVSDPFLRDEVSKYEDRIKTAITAAESVFEAQAQQLQDVLDKVILESGQTAEDVIEALGNKGRQALRDLGVDLPEDTTDNTGNPDDPSTRIDDTYSPKAALLQTLGTHSMVDSMIAGNRTITSAWRDYGLGSPNSDHITGRALDITGDNLGAYASAIRSMGGFAEMHGVDGNRHLHVVPPIGDTAVAQAPMVASVSGGGGGLAVSNHNNIVVNPSAGMNEQALAQSVVREISRMNRESMERM